MIGYLCKCCGELISIAKMGQKRDCPHCRATAHETVHGKSILANGELAA